MKQLRNLIKYIKENESEHYLNWCKEKNKDPYKFRHNRVHIFAKAKLAEAELDKLELNIQMGKGN
jgi:hypothetical protein